MIYSCCCPSSLLCLLSLLIWIPPVFGGGSARDATRGLVHYLDHMEEYGKVSFQTIPQKIESFFHGKHDKVNIHSPAIVNSLASFVSAETYAPFTLKDKEDVVDVFRKKGLKVEDVKKVYNQVEVSQLPFEEKATALGQLYTLSNKLAHSARRHKRTRFIFFK